LHIPKELEEQSEVGFFLLNEDSSRTMSNILCKLTSIPEDIPVNPCNHTFDREDYVPVKKVWYP